VAAGQPEARRAPHPEIFWVLFTVISGAMLLAVVEPARREQAAADQRIRQVRGWADQHRSYLEDLRSTRRGLEANDRALWEAVARNQGMAPPEELRLAPPAGSPR
jgi:hypothetical protein